MIALLALIIAAAALPPPKSALPPSTSGLPPSTSALALGELPPQRLAAGRCALFLWDRASRRRIAMASPAGVGAPATVTVISAGRVRTLALDPAAAPAAGAAVLGFAARAHYGDPAFSIATDLAITATDTGGAIIRAGTLTLTIADGTAIIVPVAGLIGCQPAPAPPG